MVDWAKVTELLAKQRAIDARGLLLDAWRAKRHTALADLIDAIDVRLRSDSSLFFRSGPDVPRTYAFSHDWREWFTRDPDEVANRLAMFEEYPDPAATRIILELLAVAPRQLLIAERLWSVVGRVLISLADVRALDSLPSYVDGRWPPGRTHLAIQSVPHLQFALEKLRALPPEPELVLPRALEAELGCELSAVGACSTVAPLDLAQDYARLQRFISIRSSEARLLLGDELAENGDPRGLLLNSDHDVAATPEVECLRLRAADRWLSTASHPVLKLSVRAGLPFAVTIGADAGDTAVDLRSLSIRSGAGRSQHALSEPWPMWPLIKSVTAEDWDDSLSELLHRLEEVRELRNVPWRVARGLQLGALEVLHTDDEGASLAEFTRLCPGLREFEGRCLGSSLASFDQLRLLERLTLRMPVTLHLMRELAMRSVAHRSIHTEWCEHRLTGRHEDSLKIETTVSDTWFMALGDNVVDPSQQLFAQLDALGEMFRGLAEWTLSPASIERLDILKDWLGSRPR